MRVLGGDPDAHAIFCTKSDRKAVMSGQNIGSLSTRQKSVDNLPNGSQDRCVETQRPKSGDAFDFNAAK
jgi:hypothetical protein